MCIFFKRDWLHFEIIDHFEMFVVYFVHHIKYRVIQILVQFQFIYMCNPTCVQFDKKTTKIFIV